MFQIFIHEFLKKEGFLLWNKFKERIGFIMKVKEKELKKIIKKHYYMKIVVIELSGSIFGKVTFLKTICRYNDKNGFLYFKDLINNIKINIVSQYEMLFDENKEIIQIKLDNGVNLKIRTMK